MAQYRMSLFKRLINFYSKSKNNQFNLWSKLQLGKHSLIYRSNRNLLPFSIGLNKNFESNQSYNDHNYYHYDSNFSTKLNALMLFGLAYYSIKQAECESVNKSDKELCNLNIFIIYL
jgi:hypothetical protein